MQKANAVKRMIAELTLIRMCDEALDTSTESILSRLASLEDRMATGAVQAVTGVEKKKVEEPKTTPIAEPVTPIVQKSAPTESAKRVLRPIRAWMEVVERISRSEPMTASFVKNSRAFTTEDGKVIVRFDSDFSLHMMEQGGARDRLRGAVSNVLRRDVGDRELIFEVVGKREEGSPIDEILDAMEN